MVRNFTFPISYIVFLLCISALPASFSHEKPHTFIVHVSKSHKPEMFAAHQHWYISTLSSLPPSHHSANLLYAYEHTLHGFAARLTQTQASSLRKIRGVLSVVQERLGHVHTTWSPDFLGLNQVSGLWPNSEYGDDIIIGVLDTGIWPERPSLSDIGLSSVPARWKGMCVSGTDFSASSCNKKLIGAKFFSEAYEAEYGPIDESVESRSPRDTEGHGTHTASIAAGSSVKNAGFYDYAIGEARGMATKARIAAYKICWREGCSEADILAGLDQAVADGVDIISISAGLGGSPEYDEDPFAVGAFGAVQKGILVSCAAGNSGPKSSTLENMAPWVLTVGASSIDRDFPADAILGDGTVYGGVSLYSGNPLSSSSFPLVYAGDHGHRLCVPTVNLSSEVKGKIVLCDGGYTSNVEKGITVKLAGGAAMILASDVTSGPGSPADKHIVPATMVDPTAGKKIRDYIRSQPSPTATIRFRGTVIGPSPPAPEVAPFSSRGPNDVSPEIIKPDLIAPGVNILASWTGAASPSELELDSRRVKFNIMSGTSMACPHVSGLAALLRKAHPKWSPAAIKSALMTTAYNVDNTGRDIRDFATGNTSTPFESGSGHVDPNKAVDPGLVYDLGVVDYIGFLCSIGYDEDRIAVVVKDVIVDCSTMGLTNPGYLNYPSFSVVFKSNDDVVTHKRVAKNVGQLVNAVYKVKVSGPASIGINVQPSTLVFSAKDQSLSYEVTFSSLGYQMSDTLPKFGWMEWSDGVHVVRSPIAFTWGDDFVFST